jgi:general secretion pathway protein I
MTDRRAGFTLIEILIALAILAIALAAAGRATGSATDGARVLKQRMFGEWVAQNRLNEEVIKRSFPSAGVQTGEANQAGQTFTWTQTTSQTENPKFRKVEIKVSAKGDEAYVVASLIGYLTDPQP